MVAAPSVKLICMTASSSAIEAEARAAVEVKRGRAHFELRSRVAVEPEPVAAGQRAVEHGFRPIVGFHRRERYLALEVTQARNAPGRIDDHFRSSLLGDRRLHCRDRQQSAQPGGCLPDDPHPIHGAHVA